MSRLTPKRAKFVREYLKDSNATQAAIRAGYPPKGAKQQGSRLLTFVDVQEEIARLQEAISRRLEVTVERVLNQYAKIAFANMADFCEWGPAGVKWRASAELDEADAAAVLEVCEVAPKSAGKKTRGKRQMPTRARLKIKLRDSTRALDSLAKHLGMFNKMTDDMVEALFALLPPDVVRELRAAIASQVVAAGYLQAR